jgi:hypothetical protein
MIDLLSTTETCAGHTLRAWSGVATDEGIGLICLVEVSDAAGKVVCRFEEFLPDSVQRQKDWPGSDSEAARRLQTEALERTRAAMTAEQLDSLHGHRFEAR